MDTTVDFTDLETSSPAFLVIRQSDRTLALGFGVEASGDLDLAVSVEDARRIAAALIDAADRIA